MLIRRDRAMTAITIMLDIAFHAAGRDTVSAGDLAERLGLARRGMEPLLQTLSRAGLLDSVRGPRGGYRLARPRREIRLAEIVVAANVDDAQTADGPGGRLQVAVVDLLWVELEDAACAALGTLTLDDLIRRAQTAGLKRPSSEPISFAI